MFKLKILNRMLKTNLWRTATLYTRPPLFIIYINDLPACSSSNELEFILFADETSIFFGHSDLLHNVSTWLKANKLSIDVKKAKLMIFRPRQKTLPITRQIIIENNVLEQVDNTKFFAVYIDQHLTWKTHNDMLSLLRLRFLNLSGYFIKLNTIYPQNLFLHYTMPLFIHSLLTAI